jgi:hypothetical protein
VTDSSDVAKPAPDSAAWEVRDGVLHGSTPRGTWLVSPTEYGDFILEFEFRLDRQGNSGCGLRFPTFGDPAFDGLELQMVDPRYYGPNPVGPEELTGAIYKAIPPARPLFRPEAWNRYRIHCEGARIVVHLNGIRIIDTNLDNEMGALERGAPLRDRPRRGRIGFQELSRGGGHVMIRNARIRVLDG